MRAVSRLGATRNRPTLLLDFMNGVLPPGLVYTNSSGTRYYWNASGSLATAAANEPIFEHDPLTLALRGMRWEMGSRTNNAPYSSEDNAAWSTSAASKASATSVVPGKSATLVTTSSPTGFIFQLAGTFSGAAEVAWAILEQGTGTASNLLVYNTTSSSVTANVRLEWSTMAATLAGGSGTVGVSLLSNSGPNGGKLALLWVSYTGMSGNSRSIRYYPAGTDSGTGVRHHTQIESGGYPSSIIVTGAAAVTRQPDVLTATSISPWYRQDEGTVVFEGSVSALATNANGIFVFSDGALNERFYEYISVTGTMLFAVVGGGVVQVRAATANATPANAVFRPAFAYKLNDFGGCLNGGSVVADTSGTLPTVNQLRFGAGTSSGLFPFMGYARRFSYRARHLPTPQTQRLSRV